jgi:hypothetical protein
LLTKARIRIIREPQPIPRALRIKNQGIKLTRQYARAASAISGSCNGTLREGQAVEFDIVVVKQGTVAVGKRTAKDVTCR